MRLAFYKAAKGSLLDKAVDLWTGLHGYSHCEIVFDQIEENLSFSASPREGEVRFKYINFDPDKWEFIDLPHSQQEELDIYNTATQFVGKKYDYKGIFLWFILPLHRQSDKQWWCSEICPFLLGFSNYRLSPNRFARNHNAPKQPFEFKFVWKKSY